MMEFRAPDAALDRRRIDAIVNATRPLLSGVDLDERRDEWVGSRPCTADGLPLIGRTNAPAVFVAGGHGMWGIALGPLTGKLLAHRIASGVHPSRAAWRSTRCADHAIAPAPAGPRPSAGAGVPPAGTSKETPMSGTPLHRASVTASLLIRGHVPADPVATAPPAPPPPILIPVVAASPVHRRRSRSDGLTCSSHAQGAVTHPSRQIRRRANPTTRPLTYVQVGPAARSGHHHLCMVPCSML